jgi:hypothetical protein
LIFKSAQTREWVFGAGVLIWAGCVFGHYFSWATFTDFSFLGGFKQDWQAARLSQGLANVAQVLPAWLWDTLILITFWAWGRRLGYWAGLPKSNGAIAVAGQAALGMIVFNWLWLGLGLNGLWFGPIFLVFSLLFMGPALWDFIGLIRKVKAPSFKKVLPLWVLAPVLLALVIFLLALSNSLVPEIYFDGLVYHLAVLQYWLNLHGILNFATNFHSDYPFGAELYELNGFWGGNSEGAKLLNPAVLGLTVLAAAGWVAEEAGLGLGLLSGAAVCFLPWVSTTVWTTQNEMVLALFLLLLFYAARRWAREADPSARWPWALAMGLFGGAALAVKYTAAPAFAALLAALWMENRRIFKLNRWKEWALIKAFWWGALIPWLLKSLIYTGNPIYPYFSRWIGGQSLSSERLQELMGNHESAFGTGMPFWRWPAEVAAHHLDKTMGPLLWAFIPFLFLGFTVWKKERYLLTLGFLYLAGGFLISFQTRLMIPEMALFLVGAGCFLGKIKSPGAARLWAVIVFVFGAATLLEVSRLSVDYVQGQKIWMGAEARTDFLRTSPQTASYYALAEACGKLPWGDRLLVVGDARGLYYPRQFLANSVFDDPQLVKIARRARNSEDIRQGLQRLGVDDLVFSGEEQTRLSRLYPQAYRLSTVQRKNLDDFVKRGVDLVYLEGPRAIYRLRPKLSSHPQAIPDLMLAPAGSLGL